ncbi:hypothetical protein [Spirillospora sp. NBC_01491]|uniref:hypothetical protein n=1 Tax=Spirillospora sp. NBC_01491 TaxID=2976007 RepID=UPI002E30BDD7|nr:hypothetical protein [Spirillospora sp. NBC_01491]
MRRRRGAVPGTARTAALAAPGLLVLAAGLAVSGSGSAPATAETAGTTAAGTAGTTRAAGAARAALPCANGAGDVAALVAAVRQGGDIELARGCTYRVAERYGTSAVLPETTVDTTVDGRGATVAWEGVEIAGSLFEVRGPVHITVRNLHLTSSGLTVPAMVRAGAGASFSVESSIVDASPAPGSARDDAPAPRPITRAAGETAPAAVRPVPGGGRCGRPAPAAPLAAGPMSAVIPVAARYSGDRAGDGRSCGVRAVRATRAART